MGEITAEAEAAGEAGDIEKCMQLMEKVEGLQQRLARSITARATREERLRRENRLMVLPLPLLLVLLLVLVLLRVLLLPLLLLLLLVLTAPLLQVCEVSGNFMSTSDNSERKVAHFEGKQYKGWLAIRKRLAELRAMNGARGPPRGIPGYNHERPETENGRSGERRGSGGSVSGRDHRDHSRGRGGDRDRDPMDPGRGGGGSRDRGRSPGRGGGGGGGGYREQRGGGGSRGRW